MSQIPLARMREMMCLDTAIGPKRVCIYENDTLHSNLAVTLHPSSKFFSFQQMGAFFLFFPKWCVFCLSDGNFYNNTMLTPYYLQWASRLSSYTTCLHLFFFPVVNKKVCKFSLFCIRKNKVLWEYRFLTLYADGFPCISSSLSTQSRSSFSLLPCSLSELCLGVCIFMCCAFSTPGYNNNRNWIYVSAFFSL